MSVRELAVFYLAPGAAAAAATASGGNAILPADAHDLEGPTHSALPGAILVKRQISPTSFGVDQDDYAPTGLSTADVVRLETSADVVVTGLDAPGTEYGILVENVGAFGITFAHDSASSSAENRFRCPGGADLLVPADGAVLLSYDTTTLAWRVVAASTGGSISAKEAGAVVVASASAVDFRTGFFVRDLGSGVARIDAYGKVVDYASAGASQTLDLEAGSLHDLVLDATSCAISTDGWVVDRECAMTILLRQGAGGGKLATWEAPIIWQGNVPPVLSTSVGEVDVVTLISRDGGTTIFGFYGVIPPAPTAIDDLTDVDTVSTPPGDGQALLWDDGLGQWVPGNVVTSGGSETGSVLLIADGSADFLVSEDGTAFLSMG